VQESQWLLKLHTYGLLNNSFQPPSKIRTLRTVHELAEIGAKEIWDADDPEIIRAVLSVIAIAKGLRIYGKLLVGYSEDEVSALESR
jgi:hypothetical protein